MLKYIDVNFSNLMLVNKYYSNVISNSPKYKYKIKDKLIILLGEYNLNFVHGNNLLKVAENASEKIDYCVSLINDENYIDSET